MFLSPKNKKAPPVKAGLLSSRSFSYYIAPVRPNSGPNMGPNIHAILTKKPAGPLNRPGWL